MCYIAQPSVGHYTKLLTTLVRGRAAFPFRRGYGRAILSVRLHRRSAILHRAGDLASEAIAVLARLGRVNQLAVLVDLALVVTLRQYTGWQSRGYDETRCRTNRGAGLLVVF